MGKKPKKTKQKTRSDRAEQPAEPEPDGSIDQPGAVSAAIVPVADLLRVPSGPVDLRGIDARATPGFAGDKPAAQAELPRLGARLADLQEQLYANGRSGDNRRLLLVLQGMDTSGKGGTVEHVVGSADPGGVSITSFKAPTPEELEHDFLWRIRKALPKPGMIGVFDRSHYEDVLVVRVKSLVEPDVWGARYDVINEFERELAEDGCTMIKVMLHVSPDEQKERLLARLDDPTKHWKYNPGDVAERELWPAYREAYEAALERCSTDAVPWYVVPADRKWYRNWAISQLVIEHLEALDLTWPTADFDVALERSRVAASNPE